MIAYDMGTPNEVDTEMRSSPDKDKRDPDFDFAETELFDSQLPGQCTVPIEFEEDEVILAGETQVLDIENEEDEAVVNHADETQLLDDVFMDTELVDDFDNECVVVDSECSGRTQVLDDEEDVSDDEYPRKVGSRLFDREKQVQSSCYDRGDHLLMEQTEDLAHEQQNIERCHKEGELLRNKNKCEVASTTVRKLFIEDNGFTCQRNNHEEGEDILQFPDVVDGMAGLSYIDSQEPGDATQSDALNVVENLIKENVMDFDEEIQYGKITGGKSNPISTGKQIQSLAKKASERIFFGKAGAFAWDDNCEDDGGGDFFSRRKKEFFGGSKPGKKSLTQPRKRRCKEKMVHSDSKILVNSSSKMNKEKMDDIKKSLMNEFNEPANGDGDFAAEQLEMANIGPDTQMAAEAMEALFCGEGILDKSANDCHQKTKKKPIPKKRSSLEKKCNDGVSTRQSKRIGAKSSKRSSVTATLNEVMMSSPVAKRTRLSKVVNNAENARSNKIEETSHLQEAHRGNSTDNTSVKDYEALNSKVKKSNLEPNQHEHLCPNLTDASNGSKEASLSRGRRSSRNFSSKVNDALDLDVGCKSSMQREVRVKNITRGRRSHRSARISFSDLNLKSKLDLSTLAYKALSSANKVIDKNLQEPSGDKSGSRVMIDNDKTIPTESEKVKHSDKKIDATSPVSCKSVEEKVHNSPGKRPKPSDNGVCISPVNCVTPANAASPVCMGSGYYKQSYKKSFKKMCLLRELNNLFHSGLKPASEVKDSRKRRDMANVRVLFSHHLDDDIIKHQKKILARIGASAAFSINDATHFVTDKFVRTRNMLEAIATGKPVVTDLWLQSVGQANYLVDEEKYILRDTKKEREIGFNMSLSLAHAREHPLLKGQRVLITPNAQPGKEIVASLVKAVHGQPVERVGRSAMKDDKFPDDLLILSCEEDYEICVAFLEKGASIYSSELLLNGIVTQRLEHNRHRLFADHVKRTRSTLWVRKDGRQFTPVAKHK